MKAIKATPENIEKYLGKVSMPVTPANIKKHISLVTMPTVTDNVEVDWDGDLFFGKRKEIFIGKLIQTYISPAFLLWQIQEYGYSEQQKLNIENGGTIFNLYGGALNPIMVLLNPVPEMLAKLEGHDFKHDKGGADTGRMVKKGIEIIIDSAISSGLSSWLSESDIGNYKGFICRFIRNFIAHDGFVSSEVKLVWNTDSIIGWEGGIAQVNVRILSFLYFNAIFEYAYGLREANVKSEIVSYFNKYNEHVEHWERK